MRARVLRVDERLAVERAATADREPAAEVAFCAPATIDQLARRSDLRPTATTKRGRLLLITAAA